MLSSLSPQRRRLVLAVVALLGVLAVAVGAAAASSEPARPPVAQDRPGTVLLVPGYGGSTTALRELAGALRAAGRTATVVEAPGDGRGDLRDTASALGDAAERALDAGAPSVDVVGYSAGGVVARWWVAEQGGDELARRVVTLGSPHHGTEVAALGAALGRCPPGCLQLAAGSDLLRTLNGEDETPDGPGWTTVWTDQDEVVTPPDSARLEGATQVVVQRVCPGTDLGHGDLPRSPLVAGLVLEALAAAPAPTSYGPGDCARLTA